MKRSLLTRLRTNGAYYIIAALLLLVVIPGYQLLLLNPQGYENAIQNPAHIASYLAWINAHSPYFMLYRLFLVTAFLCIITLPFSLFRIIVAQEIIGRQEIEKEEGQEESSTSENEDKDEEQANDLPPYAWRGKGFAVIAAWAGLISIIVYTLGTFASMLYFTFISRGMSATAPVPPAFSTFSSFFAILTNTAGGGLLAISTLFFGAMITRSGLRLWPGIWLAFGYVALVVAILLSINAVTVATTPVSGQAATFASPSILLFALWVLWLGIMLVRLKPET
jgi:hypothetical protein